MNFSLEKPGRTRYSACNMAKPVNFYCTAPGAKSVCLIGDFNGWNATAHPMRRQLDGTWLVQVKLHHGYHRYLFLVDGRPALDPKAAGCTCDERNQPVSLREVS